MEVVPVGAVSGVMVNVIVLLGGPFWYSGGIGSEGPLSLRMLCWP